MKKLKFYFNDKFYEKQLKIFLSMNYKDLNIVEIDNIDKYEFDTLIVSDNNLDFLYIDLSKEEDKYQNFKNIYELITKEYSRFKEIYKTPKFISIINLNFDNSENVYIRDFIENLSTEKKILLVNFNYFHRYYYDLEISLDNLLLLTKYSDFKHNTYENFNYISGTKLPLEFEKLDNLEKIFKILKKQKFDYVIFDVNFDISSKNIYILKNSDINIFYKDKGFNKNYYQNIIKFLENNSINSSKIEILKEKNNFKVIIEKEIYSMTNLKKIGKIYDFS